MVQEGAMHPNIVESEAALSAIVRAARVVAVVGMKDENEADAAAFTVPRALVARGLRVIPVNPKLTSALGEPAYGRLADVPVPFDLVDVFRRSDAIPSVADDILALPAERRPQVVWLQSGVRHDEAAERLASAGIQVVQDACLAVYAARYRSFNE
jgi:uncharacterized protein